MVRSAVARAMSSPVFLVWKKPRGSDRNFENRSILSDLTTLFDRAAAASPLA